MAVIDCPSCKKKISDKAKACSHCGLDMINVDQDKLATIKKVGFIRRSQTLMNHSFIAMLLFCGGFLFLYWSNPQVNSVQYIASITSIVLGFILYIVTRVRLIILKKSSKS
jgi:hypothetical protein